MMKLTGLVLSLVGLLGYGSAQFVQDGQCLDIALVENFDADQFLGKWYEIRRSASPTPGACSTVEVNKNTDSYTFMYNAVNRNLARKSYGAATLEDGTAKYNLNLDNEDNDFWILATDYKSYALAYSCVNISPSLRSVSFWQLSRAITDQDVPELSNTLDQLGIDIADLETVDFSSQSCYVSPISRQTLPGQCDPNFPAVPNFDVPRFTGLWHEIASYPSQNALGSCNKARYTLQDDYVIVVNSQVLDQRLEEITGTATVISDDGGGLLSVALEVLPGLFVEDTLYIVNTDYDNWAISYNCRNIDNSTREVFSWILSRAIVLSEASQQAVDAVIADISDLSFDFYQYADQSDEACFYFPEVNPAIPVEFSGGCDLNIQGMDNFDAARYLGLWHDIESYPTPSQRGICNNAFYSLAPDGIVVDVYNTEVINRTLDTINGTAVLVSDEGKAELRVTFFFVIDGVPTASQFNYTVLDTNYESYSIVYSCFQSEDGLSKQIYSWKLSRTKQLTDDARIIIDNVIAPIPVLDQRYFVARDQSPEGCFYFPEARPGVTVEFPGQCEDIAVVNNFDLARFAGTWYEIQAYPKDYQDGQCINHQFTTGIGNTLNLQSSSVYDRFREITSSVLSYSSTDNSARFNITTSSGITIPYWIIDTDYTDYALAYSCVNSAPDFRKVYSWKLSRTQQLSAAANTAINNAMANIEVLENVYYEIIDQSEAACSSIVDLTPGEPVIVPGTCNLTIPVVTNFDAARYLGRWHLIESYPSTFQDGQCNEATYSLDEDGSVVVYNTQVINQTLDAMTGRATVIASNDGEAKLMVNFANAPEPIEYWVLDTDYDTYSIVYSCVQITNELRQIYSWKLSRTKSLTDIAVAVMNQVVGSVDELNNRYYQIFDNSDEACFYFPELIPGQAITFRGQCDEGITAVQNFDVTRYLGTWYDIESYPQQFQSGTCGTANYSPGNDGVVNVLNTQVINERLDTIDAIAVLVATDGSAEFNVTFPIAGTNSTVTSPYWVLATDYDNYALVYSCSNVDSETRTVTAWKLGRTKTLTPQATITINSIMEDIIVLDDRYFLEKGQNDEDCFYYPEYDNSPESTIVFLGTCPEYIQAQANFNATAYLGRWYEVARYPTGDQFGECARADYSLGDGVVDVYNTQVVNERLLTQAGFAVVASADGNGLLNVSFDLGGGVIVNANYYVMLTDYDNFALVYSCRNISDGNRAVSSWKLSRERSGLSEQAEALMSITIDNTQGLLQDYYIPTSQSNEDCFYYPEYDNLPEYIEMPGPCSDLIQAQANFDVAAYLGRWYEVARYPTGDQFGECARADYSLGDGVVDVYNTQVVNERLLTQAGFAVVASADGNGQLNVSFDLGGGVIVNANYYVMLTDYDNFALVYSCRNISDGNRAVSSWKLSRERSGLSEQAEALMSITIDNTQGLLQDYYIPTSQSNEDCFYYPEYDNLPEYIEMPGPCSDLIQAQANFDAAAYLGRWYEVARYPTGDQFGECARADYSLGDGVVDVYNTQVVNEQLLTQAGFAVVASADGNGLLNVSFDLGGGVIVNANYYVMLTDYDNFALVYSCRNISDGNRAVSSWKLSRDRSGLSEQAEALISNIVNSTQGLLQDYYINTSQSDDDCFYIPEVDNSADVRFRGQCEDITGVQNFDIERYLGWWHEIERYPTSAPTGECTSSQFEASGNQYLVVDTSVTDQNGQTDTSVVTATTNGLLRRTLTNGQVIDTWVLATDYETYSLLYSCENIDNEYRRVWSAKHSKSRQLTTAAQNAMAPLINNNRVLYPQFYREVDQGGDACFYNPEADGRPVILDGRCDENIAVVQNFDAGAYTGTWYQIERYPQRFEPGSECTGARYTLDESTEIITVLNWEVIDGELDTIEGNATITSNAKFAVVLPNRGEGDEETVTQSLYVLTTDYSSYSLVYSCVDINEYQRQLAVWKLSRTRTMPAAGNTAINSYIATRPEISQQYFLQITQYEDCLEPRSAGVFFKSSVVVLLVCALAQLLF